MQWVCCGIAVREDYWGRIRRSGLAAMEFFPAAADRRLEANAMRWNCLAAMAAVVSGGMILAPVVQADSPPWVYTHPDAKVLIGVDWQRVKSSPTGQMIRRQLLEMGGTFTSSTQGLEFIDTVDRILISAPGELSGGAQESPFIMALEGVLDAAALRKSMIPGTAVERYRGLDLLIPPRGPEGQDMVAALVNDRLTLIGDRASIELVLEDGNGLRDLVLRDRAAAIASDSEIWMIAATPPVKAGTAGADNPFASGLDELKAMDFGLSLARGLGLKMNLQFEDAASAQSLALGAQMLTSMFMTGDSASPEIAQIARSLHIEQTGADLRVNLDIPLDLLERGVMQAKSGITEAAPRTLETLLGMGSGSAPLPGIRPAVKNAGQPVAAATPAPSRAPAAPAQPVKRTIRIVGLDEGDREINYTVGGRRP